MAKQQNPYKEPSEKDKNKLIDYEQKEGILSFLGWKWLNKIPSIFDGDEINEKENKKKKK